MAPCHWKTFHSVHVSTRQHTSAHVSTQHISTRQHTSAHITCQHTSAHISTHQHTSAHVRSSVKGVLSCTTCPWVLFPVSGFCGSFPLLILWCGYFSILGFALVVNIIDFYITEHTAAQEVVMWWIKTSWHYIFLVGNSHSGYIPHAHIYEMCPEGIQPCTLKNRDIYWRR